MAGKAKRLNKVAKEFNISIATIVEFLGSKGFEIDSKPNTKIEGEILGVLEEEFADDKEAKKNSENAVVGAEKRESLSIKDIKKAEPSASDEDDEDEDEVVEEPVKKEVVAEKVEEVVEEKIEEPKEEKPKTGKPAIEPVEDDSKVGTKVIGKIDLDAINQKTRPDKASKKAKEEKAKEEEAKKEEKVEAKAEEVKEEPKKRSASRN